MAASIYDWSLVAANNGNSDADSTWVEGQAPSSVNNTGRSDRMRVRQLLTDIAGSLAAGGTANGLTVTAASPFAAYADGMIISFRATASNTAAATLSVNAIGAKAIRKMSATGDSALGAGDIQNTGIYVAQYSAALNGAAGAWLLVNPTISSLTLLELTLTSTDAGAAAGPVLTLYRNSATPAAADIIGKVLYQGEDSAGNTEDYVETYATITDPTSTSEDATYLIRGKLAGTMTTCATFGGAVGALLPIVDINGGTIDGTVIGGASAAAGTFTTIAGTTGTFSGVVTAPNGSAAAPGFKFASSQSGIYRTAVDGGVGFSVGAGNPMGSFHSTGLTVQNAAASDALISPNGPSTGASIAEAGSFTNYIATGINAQLGSGQSSWNAINFIRGGVSVGTISCSPGATSYNTSSDKDLKFDWQEFDAGAILDALEVWKFKWKENGASGYGVLAQDAYEVFPEGITKPKDDVKTWSADYSKFVPLLLAEIKDLRRRLAAAGL